MGICCKVSLKIHQSVNTGLPREPAAFLISFEQLSSTLPPGSSFGHTQWGSPAHHIDPRVGPRATTDVADSGLFCRH